MYRVLLKKSTANILAVPLINNTIVLPKDEHTDLQSCTQLILSELEDLLQPF